MTEINIDDYSAFVVTGKLVRGGRFVKNFEGTRAGAMWAMGINLWRGNVWGVRKDTGRRQLIKSVTN